MRSETGEQNGRHMAKVLLCVCVWLSPAFADLLDRLDFEVAGTRRHTGTKTRTQTQTETRTHTHKRIRHARARPKICGAVVVRQTRTICGAIKLCGSILWAQGNPRPTDDSRARGRVWKDGGTGGGMGRTGAAFWRPHALTFAEGRRGERQGLAGNGRDGRREGRAIEKRGSDAFPWMGGRCTRRWVGIERGRGGCEGMDKWVGGGGCRWEWERGPGGEKGGRVGEGCQGERKDRNIGRGKASDGRTERASSLEKKEAMEDRAIAYFLLLLYRFLPSSSPSLTSFFFWRRPRR